MLCFVNIADINYKKSDLRSRLGVLSLYEEGKKREIKNKKINILFKMFFLLKIFTFAPFLSITPYNYE